jgi:DNA-binding CsgD family transcriptional regulator
VGLALTTLGRIQPGAEGLPCLAEAVRLLEVGDSRLALAEALIQYGAALRRQQMLAQSRPALRRGLALAQECGASGLARRARTQLWATGARPHPIGDLGWSSLTVAERRVAELAGAGQPNRAIAEALFVTVKTVETHLSSAYRKLGIRNRAALGSLQEVGEPPG